MAGSIPSFHPRTGAPEDRIRHLETFLARYLPLVGQAVAQGAGGAGLSTSPPDVGNPPLAGDTELTPDVTGPPDDNRVEQIQRTPIPAPDAGDELFLVRVNATADAFEYVDPVTLDTGTRIDFNPHAVTIPSAGVSYRMTLTFSADGVFDDRCYHAQCTCDEAGPVIEEDQNQKTTGVCSWIIYVPSDSAAGSYGNALALLLTPQLKGTGWTGTAGPFNGVWTGPTPIL